jgi:hypothetical protein
LAQQAENQSIQRRCLAVESLAEIDILDLDDPATAPPDSVDRMDSVTPVANEPGFDDLRQGFPTFPLSFGGLGKPPVCSASASCVHSVTLPLGMRSICR